MNVRLSPEDEALVEEKVRSGEFQSREAVVAHGLSLIRKTTGLPTRQLSGEERAKGLEEFFAAVDRDPPSEAGPLSDEALSPESLNDTARTRV